MPDTTADQPAGAAAARSVSGHDAAPPETGPGERALAGALRTVFGVLRVLMLVVLVALLFSNTRFLQQNQRAVILRFGKIVGTGAAQVRGPGLVFAWPQPIDEIIVVDAGRVLSLDVEDFMFRAEWRDEQKDVRDNPLDPARDGYTLTSDANIIHSSWLVEYRIDDVVRYALHIEDAEALIRHALAAAVVRTSAEFDVKEALWDKVEAMRLRVVDRLQQQLDDVESGIRVERVRTMARREPKQTELEFRKQQDERQAADTMVTEAKRIRQDRLADAAGDAGEPLAAVIAALAAAEEAPDAERGTTALDGLRRLAAAGAPLAAALATVEEKPEAERGEAALEALRKEVSRLLGTAAGEAAGILSNARGRKATVIADAVGMAKEFRNLDREYRSNPGVFVRERYQSKITQILRQAGVKFVLYPRTREWRILLEPRRRKKAQAQTPTEVQRTAGEFGRMR